MKTKTNIEGKKVAEYKKSDNKISVRINLHNNF